MMTHATWERKKEVRWGWGEKKKALKEMSEESIEFFLLKI
jgi:hypothetical protein